MRCPKHVSKYVKNPEEEMCTLFGVKKEQNPLAVQCVCANDEFKILINELPIVDAICTKCEEKIKLYDLNFYPAATIIPASDEYIKYYSSEGDSVFNLCVLFEYPELEKDEVFDPDDISWCIIWGRGIKSGQVFEILNDETA